MSVCPRENLHFGQARHALYVADAAPVGQHLGERRPARKSPADTAQCRLHRRPRIPKPTGDPPTLLLGPFPRALVKGIGPREDSRDGEHRPKACVSLESPPVRHARIVGEMLIAVNQNCGAIDPCAIYGCWKRLVYSSSLLLREAVALG